MFHYNIKIALPALLKSKYTSAINLTGLVVGMTAALLLWQYVAAYCYGDALANYLNQTVKS